MMKRVPPRAVSRRAGRIISATAALITAASASAIALSPSAAATPVLAAAPVGVQWNAAADDYNSMPQKMADLASTGVREVSMPVSWWYVCPQWNYCDYSQLDRTISTAASNGLQVSLQVNGTPDWLHPDRAGDAPDTRHWMLPRDDNERASLQAFAQQLASRYAGKVHRYDWGNEPDLLKYSTTGISPDNYARSLASFYLGIKAGDSNAIVASAGLSRASVGFAQLMINTLNSLPNAAANNGFYDELGLHPYADSNSPLVHDPAKVYQTQFGITDFNFDGYKLFENLLNNVGRPNTRIWMSELGYSTIDTWMKAVPDQQRAMYLMMATDVVRSDWRLDGLAWHAAYATPGVGPEWALSGGSGAQAIKRANGGRVARDTASGCDAGTLSGVTTWQPGCFGLSAGDVTRTEVYVDGYPVAWTSTSVASLDTSTVSQGQHSISVGYYNATGPVAYSAPRTVTIAAGGNVALAPSTTTTLVSTSPTVSSGSLYFTVSSRTVRFDTSFTATSSMTLPTVVVAVRNSAGVAYDPAPHTNVWVGPGSWTAYSESRSFPPGTYTATPSAVVNGTWQAVGASRTFVIQ